MAARSLTPTGCADFRSVARNLQHSLFRARLQQRSDQSPYHLPQKMRSRDSEPDQMFISCDSDSFSLVGERE
jgi:hypothetical protein